MADFGLIIPTLNATRWLPALLPALAEQRAQPSRFVVIDSSSDDETAATFRRAGAEVVMINRADFDHGHTRQLALEHIGDLPLVILMTQDALPEGPATFANLLNAFDDPQVGIAYGRQLPRREAKAIEAHARLFNYPETSARDSRETLVTRGVRATFCSNSFAAYRVGALRQAGGFPANCIFGEDAIVATRMMLAGWDKAYAADAKVYHSHSYSLKQDFQRNFDVGVMHADYAELWHQFGIPSREGSRFVKSELAYLLRHDPLAIPSAVARTALKLTGYTAGQMYRSIPNGPRLALSMNKAYWRRQAKEGGEWSRASA